MGSLPDRQYQLRPQGPGCSSTYWGRGDADALGFQLFYLIIGAWARGWGSLQFGLEGLISGLLV